ncbi:hypothetical protein T05_10759 [Trichinella murrelli]|uniref:Uncharacterized protein n=1 Tax=Trichinella murrelli TaxID=144512 RepID=A0A0V0TD86_9BILA|nr:hypothetical protein T05_10759 [Trichinella murrelli]
MIVTYLQFKFHTVRYGTGKFECNPILVTFLITQPMETARRMKQIHHSTYMANTENYPHFQYLFQTIIIFKITVKERKHTFVLE